MNHKPGQEFNAPALIFGARVRPDDISDLTTKRSVDNLQAAEEELRDKFNGSALDAGLAAISPRLKNGLVAIQVPPCTGKTYLSAEIVIQYLKNLKLKVLSTAEKKSAVMVCIEKFWRHPDSKNLNWAVHDTNVSVDEAEAMYEVISAPDYELSVNDMATSHNFFYLFAQWKKVVLQDNNHPLHLLVSNYEGLLREYEISLSQPCDPEEKQRLKENFLDVEAVVYREFGKIIDIVFSTNNSSAAKPLVAAFPAEALFMDEAGLSNRTSAAIPMANYRFTLQRVILVGDHQQLKPFFMKTGQNEALDWLKSSILELTSVHKDTTTIILY
jgi:AAA domain-containing protein